MVSDLTINLGEIVWQVCIMSVTALRIMTEIRDFLSPAALFFKCFVRLGLVFYEEGGSARKHYFRRRQNSKW